MITEEQEIQQYVRAEFDCCTFCGKVRTPIRRLIGFLNGSPLYTNRNGETTICTNIREGCQLAVDISKTKTWEKI